MGGGGGGGVAGAINILNVPGPSRYLHDLVIKEKTYIPSFRSNHVKSDYIAREI